MTGVKGLDNNEVVNVVNGMGGERIWPIGGGQSRMRCLIIQIHKENHGTINTKMFLPFLPVHPVYVEVFPYPCISNITYTFAAKIKPTTIA